MAIRIDLICPSCKDEESKTTIRSIVPMVVKDTIVEAGMYAVCMACYEKQWADVYSESSGFASYKEYLADKYSKKE